MRLVGREAHVHGGAVGDGSDPRDVRDGLPEDATALLEREEEVVAREEARDLDQRPLRDAPAGARESHVHDVTITKEAPNYRSE